MQASNKNGAGPDFISTERKGKLIRNDGDGILADHVSSRYPSGAGTAGITAAVSGGSSPFPPRFPGTCICCLGVLQQWPADEL